MEIPDGGSGARSAVAVVVVVDDVSSANDRPCELPWRHG